MAPLSHLPSLPQWDKQLTVCAANTNNSAEASATCGDSRCDREKAFDKAHSISGRPLGLLVLLGSEWQSARPQPFFMTANGVSLDHWFGVYVCVSVFKCMLDQ